MKTVSFGDLAALSAQAAAGARRRHNLNLHSTLDEPVQRLLNAIEPGTYVRPHCHVEPGRFELFVAVAGRAVIVTFDDAGVVTERVELAPDGVPVVEIPPGTWHTLAALAPGTVLLEVKQGPYRPLPAEGFAPWAPAEDSAKAVALERWFRVARVGQTAPR